jgi:hypothetical protein
MRTCILCENKHHAKGYCLKCYLKKYKSTPEYKKRACEQKKIKYHSDPEFRKKIIFYRKTSAKKAYILNPEDIDKFGYVGHHLSKECVIYLPVSIHGAISHSPKRPESMERINTAAYAWLLGVV